VNAPYLRGLSRLPNRLVQKLAAGEEASDVGESIEPHEPTPAEKAKILGLVDQIRCAREGHERETGKLIEVEKPLLPGELPPEE
jgi:hypothetical protein